MLIPDYMSGLSGQREISCLEKQQSHETESYVKLIIDQLPATDQRLQVVVVVLLFYVHGKHLRSCRDGQLN